MPAFILSICTFLGISPLRLIMYSICFIAVLSCGIAIRNHYVNLGYHKAIADVRKQDDRAIDAANKVEEKAAQCDDTSGYWDVITQACKLQDDPAPAVEKK